MTFTIPVYQPPDFSADALRSAPEITLRPAPMDGVPPEGFYLTTALPEYYRWKGEWVLPPSSVPFCCAVLRDDRFHFMECGDVKAGDRVVIAQRANGSEGVYAHVHAFPEVETVLRTLPYEESESEKYDFLCQLMRHQKENGGHIVWVLGPAVVFNYDTRLALEALAKHGYVQAVLAGNAMATHDLEGGYLNTALGQDIYTQEAMPGGHYNHLDTINECRRMGSIEDFANSPHIKDGFMKVLVEEGIPFVLAGSIRDDGPLPSVHASMDDSIRKMTEALQKATLVINLATLLHGAAASGMVSGYRVVDGKVLPVFVYTVDINSYTEASVAKVRHDFLTKSFVTNVQDFVFTLKKILVGPKKEVAR